MTAGRLVIPTPGFLYRELPSPWCTASCNSDPLSRAQRAVLSHFSGRNKQGQEAGMGTAWVRYPQAG